MPQGPAAITIHERAAEDGTWLPTRLRATPGGLELLTGERCAPLPDGALEAVLARYGKAMGVALAACAVQESLDLPSGARLVRFRFRPRYDVIARDYLALVAPGQEPVCELAIAVTGALEHLAARHAAALEALAGG